MNATTTLAADWIQIGTGLGNDTKTLIFGVLIPAMCGAFVLIVGFKTRAPGPTAMAALLAAVVWGLSADMDSLKDKTTDTVNQYDGPTSIQRGDR
ncbi:hypothetical protein [Streptomyces melanogenes]|uniref:hypothetical protein n=1 Tax=Streptomyces melanogenes TaxID=67326 RepID=UPI0037B1536E